MAHDKHFHCFDFPSGVKAGASGSAVRSDTWMRLLKPKKASTDLEFYSLTQDLQALEAALNKKIKGYARLDTLGKSAGGRDLHVLKLGQNAVDKPKKARVLFNSGLHAREWIGPTYTYLIAEWLVGNYPASGAGKTDAEKIAKGLLDENHLWVAPLCNPDGHEHSVTITRMQRKNSPGGDNHFISAPGKKEKIDPKAPPSIDLNRNFDTRNWKAVVTSGKGDFDTDIDAENFCGKGPAEAQEVKLLQHMIDATPFDLAVDYHSFDCAMMWPPGDDSGASPIDARLQAFINSMKTQVNKKAKEAKNQTTNTTTDTWRTSQIALYYAMVRGIAKADSVIPGSISDYVHYAALKAKRDCVAFSTELPPMHHTGSPGFALPEKHIPAVFRQIIGTSLALIKNAQNKSPTQADFDPFDKIA